jgi:hypothetical protein
VRRRCSKAWAYPGGHRVRPACLPSLC